MTTDLTGLTHHLDRTITIGARPDTVFSFFTRDDRWASWWGTGSSIDARPGGRVLIRHPNGVEVSGEVLDVQPPERLVFTYGYPNNPTLGPGGSRVTIQLTPVAAGTRLTLRHDLADVRDRDHHVQGWRYQLSLFANVVADVAQAKAESAVDEWFAIWAEPDAAVRETRLGAIALPAVRFRDRYSLVDSVADLVPHIGATQQFMPGLRIARSGQVRHCQGTVVADWKVAGANGEPRGGGVNVFSFDSDGRIEQVTGIWS
jgi:uncharacterized protein YndB with AHSA1/START domain